MEKSIRKIQRAIISVSEKTDLLPLANLLKEFKIEIFSSGGTFSFLKESGVPVEEISQYTQSPEILDGRVKTLHPKIHGGILARRHLEKDHEDLRANDILPFDLVIVNLYPFEEAYAAGNLPESDLIEKIDIGGPTLLRSAAKNFQDVTVIHSPDQYPELISQLQSLKGGTSIAFRRQCAQHIFERTSNYDAAIAKYFGASDPIPTRLPLGLKKSMDLRYGENPHQKAAYYLPEYSILGGLLETPIQGKELSFNNILDIHAAVDLMLDLNAPYSAAILKHTNPCGVGISQESLLEAYERALMGDPISAFGGVVVLSGSVSVDLANKINETFTEIVIAPHFEDSALEVFSKKKNLRLLKLDYSKAEQALLGNDIRRVLDGYLLQERDRKKETPIEAKTVTKRNATADETQALILAWTVCKHVKSNAIVLASSHRTLGIGAGQMSRVDSSRIAVVKAGKIQASPIVLASDAFFPFRDGVDAASEAGVTAIIQPGGSMRDQEVIEAANLANIAMLFTGVRHFKH